MFMGVLYVAAGTWLLSGGGKALSIDTAAATILGVALVGYGLFRGIRAFMALRIKQG